MAKGSKRVAWKNIKAQNTWYISKTFLLNRRTFDNPTRLSESDLRAYWEHWFKRSQSGDEFTFKRVVAYGGKGNSQSDSETSNQQEEKKSQKKSESKEEEGEEEEEDEGKAKAKVKNRGDGDEDGEDGEDEDEGERGSNSREKREGGESDGE